MPKIIVKEEVTRIVRVGGAGIPGPAGPGVPAGGTAGQLLRKATGDFNTQWSDTAPDTDKVAGVAAATVIDRLGAVETGQASAVIGRATQAELLAVVPPDEDAVGYVGADPDPAKNGNYHREGGSWVQSSFDRVAQVEASLDFLKGSQLAESVPNQLPDLWRDGPFFRTSGGAEKVTRAGFKTLRLWSTGLQSFRTIQVPASNFTGGKFDASVVIVEKTAIAGVTFLIRQNASDGSEVAGTRVTATIPSAAISSPTFYRFTNIVIDPTCENVEFWLGAGSSDGAEVWFALPLLASATGWSGYRTKALTPRVEVLEAALPPLPGKITDLEQSAYLPNLVIDCFFEDLTKWEGGGTIVRDDMNGIPTAKTTGSYRYFTINRDDILGDVISYSCRVAAQEGGVSRILLRQMDAGGAEILTARKETSIPLADTKPKTYKVENATIDAACVEIQVWIDRQNATSIHWQLPCVTLGSTAPAFRGPAYQPRGGASTPGTVSTGVVYVATNGNDEALGDISNPVATLNKAVEKLSGNGTIVVRGGDYTAGASLGSAKRLRIFAYPQERVRILLGTQLAGIAKTDGYTKVYEAALASAPNKHIFEHETPEGLIPDSERHSLQRGREYRLPSTRLWPVASIADVEADPRPTWYYDDAADKIYFSASDGGDATTRDYYAPSGSACSGGTAKTDIEIQGLEAWYGDWNFSNCGSYRAVDLIAIGARGDGIIGNYSSGIEIRCEGGGCGNDGMNAHHQIVTPEATTRNGVYLRIDPWAHDNYDDGNSIHERCQETILGGLFEYNGDRGVVPASGAHTTVRGAYSRKNGQNTRGVAITGEGFGMINTNQAGEGGVGTQMECYDCISDADNYGFACHSVDGAVRAFNCKTIDAEIAAYSADKGNLYLEDCRDSGSGTVKSETNGGIITVRNGSLVV